MCNTLTKWAFWDFTANNLIEAKEHGRIFLNTER